MKKQTSFLFLFSFFVFLLGFALFNTEEVSAKPIDRYDEYEHISFSANKWETIRSGCGLSIGAACLDSFPSYQSNYIVQTYKHRVRSEHHVWDPTDYWQCTSYERDKWGYSTGNCLDGYWVGGWDWTHTTYTGWTIGTKGSYGSQVRTPLPGIPERYNGNIRQALWEHRINHVDPGGWYGNAPTIAPSDIKLGYSAWVKQIEQFYINRGQGGEWTYEYMAPAYPTCTKRYGNEVVTGCGHEGRDPGLYGEVKEGSVYNHNFIKVLYYYKDPYTHVTEDTRGTKIGTIQDNYTTRWWLRDVAIEGTAKYRSLDVVNPFTYDAKHWEIYGGEKRQFQCYAYYYKDPRDTDRQERLTITDYYPHSWRTNRTGVQGDFAATGTYPNESPSSYFHGDTRWIGNGRYNVPYKNPRAYNSSLYWHWNQDASRILAPAGVYQGNEREDSQRWHRLSSRGQYYMLDVLYNGPQELNCDLDHTWYDSGNIPLVIKPSGSQEAYRNLTMNGSAPHRNIKRNPQALKIHGVKDIDLLISGTFYKHTNRNDTNGTDQMIVYSRKVETIQNGEETIDGVGQYYSQPLRIENTSRGAVPNELKDLYFLKGHWYNFEIEVEYLDGTKRLLNGAPEAHWTADPWILGQSSYRKQTNNLAGSLRTMMPYNGLEHQIAHNGIHNVHFEWFDNVYRSNGAGNPTPQPPAQQEITISGILAKDAVGVGFGTEPNSYNTIKGMIENPPAHRTGWSGYIYQCDNTRTSQIDPATGQPMSPWVEEDRYLSDDSGRDKIYDVTDPYYKQQILKLPNGEDIYNKAAAAGVKLKYQTNTKVEVYKRNYRPLPCKNGDKGFYYNNQDFRLTATFTPEAPAPTLPPTGGGGNPGKTSFDFQFKAAEIVSMDIYNEQNQLGPTRLNTGDTHQFKAIMTFDAGGGREFEYDWTKYMNIWGVDNHTVKKVDNTPGKFYFPKEEGIYGEHQRAGTEAERVDRVIFAVWFDDVLNYVNFTNRKTDERNPMNIYGVAKHWDAFGDMHIVKLKDDCSNIELLVEKCELPRNSWRINITDLTPTNFIPYPNNPEVYGENPYFLKFEFPVTGTSNGVGTN